MVALLLLILPPIENKCIKRNGKDAVCLMFPAAMRNNYMRSLDMGITTWYIFIANSYMPTKMHRRH
jgi:hypothetical protein